ncbi:hypothetical protein KAFR_0G02310 [Kazachstania africana CBS 2517]|uniref:precorrin-2 dehydrogenase n=1 Tax=Kazachstania africana (strain ATCC 22294 / BCRC 22015 / CBS 2517 / CECT 1963 / NBRC 1671 / NRRL Y-8276) TaxID=1071382 RepID=H2AY15_KAZAF|nr:hypothetical protein KAFR_0G02310 [Kazachstania africana CBS 2517]CCF59265.1 hypothetical protein KAFR_0G02310 [Kazachstania africana CBS 2517]
MVQSLQLAHRLEDLNVLLIGAGKIASTRFPKLLPTGCKLTVVAREIDETFYESFVSGQLEGTNEGWSSAKQEIYRIVRDEFKTEYLELENYWHIILVCISDIGRSESIYSECILKYGESQLINVADVPKFCNFYFGSNLNLADDKLQILVSSNGASPRFTALVRNEIAKTFDDDLELSIAMTKLKELRSEIRRLTNASREKTDIQFRMEWVRRCTDIYGLRYCHLLDVESLLELFSEMYSNRSLTFPPKDEMLTKYLSVN